MRYLFEAPLSGTCFTTLLQGATLVPRIVRVQRILTSGVGHYPYGLLSC